MRLYDALTYLQDSGHEGDSISVYLLDGPGFMCSLYDALDEQGWYGSRISEWYDNEVLYEPHIDGGGRWVLCVGYPNGDQPAPSWDGFFSPGELPDVRDDWNDLNGTIRNDQPSIHYKR